MPIRSNVRVPRGVVWSPFNQGAGTDRRHRRRHHRDHRCEDRADLMFGARPDRSRGRCCGPRCSSSSARSSSSSSSASCRRCSWSGTNARSCRACRTGSARTRRVRSACCRRSPTASRPSSRKTSCRAARTGSSSGSHRSWRSSPRSCCGRSFRWAATSPMAVTAPSRGSARSPACSWPTRPSASCGCSRCRRSVSTASCSPAGRAGRSTRCSARCAPRRR